MALAGRIKGGAKLKRFVRKAKAAQAAGVKQIDLGFFQSARYPDGTPVTNVAAWNEFGTKRADGSTLAPSRPFFRNSMPEIRDTVSKMLKQRVDPQTMTVTPALAGLMGEACKTIIQQSIRKLDNPANARSTISRKGSTNPLIDTGFMRMSVNYEIHK